MIRLLFMALFLLSSCSYDNDATSSFFADVSGGIPTNGESLRLTKYSYNLKSLGKVSHFSNDRIFFSDPFDSKYSYEIGNETGVSFERVKFSVWNLKRFAPGIMSSGYSLADNSSIDMFNEDDLSRIKGVYGTRCRYPVFLSEGRFSCRSSYSIDHLYVKETKKWDVGEIRTKTIVGEWVPSALELPGNGHISATVDDESIVVGFYEYEDPDKKANHLYHVEIDFEKEKMSFKKLFEFEKVRFQSMQSVNDQEIIFTTSRNFKTPLKREGIWTLNKKNIEEPPLQVVSGRVENLSLTHTGGMFYERLNDLGHWILWYKPDTSTKANSLQVFDESNVNQNVRYLDPALTKKGRLYYRADKVRQNKFDLWVMDARKKLNLNIQEL